MTSAALAVRAKGVLSAVAARLPRMAHPATGYLLLFMIAAGVVLRIQNVGYPFHFGFDEHQYAGAAHQFMVGVPDKAECCHPPLSKVLIGVGMLLFGNTPLGWRFAPLCFGLQCILLVFLITRTLFRDPKVGWFAAAFMAADGFYLTYSRASLPDIILACLVLWCMFAAIHARGWGGVMACALLVGVASGIKWVALLVGLPACFAILLRKSAPWYSLACFAVVPFVHLAVWMLGLHLIGYPNDPLSVWKEMMARRDLHLGFPHHTNPLESVWYTWLVLYHPIIVKMTHVGNQVKVASSIGNPVLWLAADLCLVALPIAGVLVATKKRWKKRWDRLFDTRFSQGLAILGVSWLCMMLLWMTERIVTYWYHYLTPWAFAIMIVAGVVARLDRRYPRDVLTFVAVVLVVSIFYAPVWAEFPISVAEARRRLPFPLWW